MVNSTALNAFHRRLGARMVDFGGWDMPMNYGSQIEEHHAVRRAAGMFDVSHMSVIDLTGSQVRAFLQRLMANDVDKLKAAGKAQYTCMLNADGGIIDDLIVYFLGEERYRLVGNAGTRAKDLAWINEQAKGFAVSVVEHSDLAMIAIQGPEARARVGAIVSPEAAAKAKALKRFSAVSHDGLFIARTGYTGEDGYEITLPATDAEAFWQALLDAGVQPCGLAARDTLRLEAGMNLYGQDMDETTTPLTTSLAWTVSMAPERDFIGRDRLLAQQAQGVAEQLVGLVLEGKGIMRHGQSVIAGDGEGLVTSGTFSPTLERTIALARIPAGDIETVQVDIRGRQVPARVVAPPFVRNGEPQHGL
ncbi:MAG: glycine cleavage system aminomethyltransferase GcvT [Xanthomonadales bacterium]|nr:glycine cleavage system aminomethyltransferase GcvT [Xanthomonadales bacterium]